MEVSIVLRRLLLILLPLALVASPCLAVDAGVKGAGAIAATPISVGTFDVNVARTGNVVSGGFKYVEYSNNQVNSRPVNVVYSQTLVSLQVVGNFATVQAIGYWNGMLSDLTLQARDNGSAARDWFHIVARPRNLLTVILDRSGDLIKGDLVVVGSTPAPGYTAGEGAIQVGNNIGAFQFKAQNANTGATGYAYYWEIAANSSSVARQPVRVYLPRVEQLTIVDKTAVFGGRGTLNGRPALIEIKAVDNFTPGPIMPPVKADEFYVTARPLFTDSAAAGYSAGGPLIKGDVKVVPLP